MARSSVEEVPDLPRGPRKRRSEVLEAAARIFHEKGYESTTTRDIAEALGILKGSLYYYVRTKEDLLYEILRAAHDEALENIRRVQDLEVRPLSKIRAFIITHLTFNAENLVRMGVFFHDFRSLSEERKQVIVEERDVYDQILVELIRQGQAEGQVCPDLDGRLAAFAIMGMTNWIYNWYRPWGASSVADISRQFADLVISGLVCDPKTHRTGHRGEIAPVPLAFDPSPVSRQDD